MNEMDDRHIKVLLIEDNPGDARLIREMLAEVRGATFDLEWVDRLSAGLERLAEGGFDMVLLDLGLPDSQGIDTFVTLQAQAPRVPIIVLTGLDDEALAVKAVQEGAQDHLVKGQVDSHALVRSIRYAVERHRLLRELEQAWLREQEQLRALSLVDELTGLYNRRGFLTLAQQQLKLANRTKRGMLLLFADLDDLKGINDTLGHHEGDLALIQTANTLKDAFRESDIIGRIGGDEFAVLAIGASKESAEILTTRLQERLEARNAKANPRYKLSLSAGIAYYDPECPCSIDELLARADRLMYEQKRGKPELLAQ